MAVSSKMKTIIGRTVLAALYIAVIILMFIFGRTHTLLIDNKSDPDGSWKAVNGMEITIDKKAPIEFLRGDRDKLTVKGQTHTLHITFFDGTAPFTAKIRIPIEDDAVLLSVPKLLAGIEPYMELFDMYGQTAPRAGPSEEEPPPSILNF